MEVSRIENLPTPPGIINSIKAGFDMIASHITAILLPLMLNLFLWLGPRLRMNALFDSIKSEVIAIWKHFCLKRQKRTARIDKINAWQPVFGRDLLRAKMLFHCHGKISTALNCGVVRNNHTVLTADDSDSRHNSRTWGSAIIEAPRRKCRKL